MKLYAASGLPVRDALAKAHEDTLASFATPGQWFDGHERTALVEEARQARRTAGLDDSPAPPAPLSTAVHETARRVARQVAVSTNQLDRNFFDEALAEGLSEEAYVEVVGVVSRAVNVDVFARGIGQPSPTLLPPVAGRPGRQRPRTARNEGAWAASVPGGARGEDEAIALYGSKDPQAAPYIYRALSLVPREAAGLMQLGAAQYLQIQDFMDPGFSYEPTLSRAQLELVAARVSALNACFY